MGIFDIFSKPQQVVEDTVSSVSNSVSGSVGSLLTAPFKALSGLAHGVMGSLWSGATYTAIVLGVRTLAPNLWLAGLKAIKGPNAGNEMADQMNKGGVPELILDSAKYGFGAAAAIGGAQGALQEAGLVGGGLVMAAVGAVTLGAIHHADGTNPTPTPNLPGTKSVSGQTKH